MTAEKRYTTMHAASVSTFQFTRESLQPLAEKLKQEWVNASPFPYIMVDDMFPPDLLDAVLAEYPGAEDVDWQRFDAPTELKLAIADMTQMGVTTKHVLNEMNGQVFLEFLETVTGMDGLIPDAHLWGGGLHQIRRGGFLKVHADFNRHKKLKLDRRLNAL